MNITVDVLSGMVKQFTGIDLNLPSIPRPITELNALEAAQVAQGVFRALRPQQEEQVGDVQDLLVEFFCDECKAYHIKKIRDLNQLGIGDSDE